MSKKKMFASDSVIEEFYKALADNNEAKLRRVHIPHSSVFYAREAYHQHSGEWVSLDRIERAMFLEGMISRYDVLDPDRKRDWE